MENDPSDKTCKRRYIPYVVPIFSEQLFCVVTVLFESRVGEVYPSLVVSSESQNVILKGRTLA